MWDYLEKRKAVILYGLDLVAEGAASMLEWAKRVPQKRIWRPAALVTVVGVLLYLGLPYGPQIWAAYKADRDSFTPFFTPIGALLVGLAAFGQWRTARLRHEEQTNADRQRRITENFSKAIEHLGNDKIEVRLGGIYALERISKESPDDYWTAIENLTAFVQWRTQRAEAERDSNLLERIAVRAYFLWESAGKPEGRDEDFREQAVKQEKLGEVPPMDIAAVLTVLRRRGEKDRKRERDSVFGYYAWNMIVQDPSVWRIDLRGAVLRQANLDGIHLEAADLRDAHLEGANLAHAYLQGADLRGAHLEGAMLDRAELEGADLRGAHLEGADLSSVLLRRANLESACLKGAILDRALMQDTILKGANLEGASLNAALMDDAQLEEAKLAGARSRRESG
jgi:uncharacterized protein YjbI with pentapeptide repeats